MKEIIMPIQFTLSVEDNSASVDRLRELLLMYLTHKVNLGIQVNLGCPDGFTITRVN